MVSAASQHMIRRAIPSCRVVSMQLAHADPLLALAFTPHSTTDPCSTLSLKTPNVGLVLCHVAGKGVRHFSTRQGVEKSLFLYNSSILLIFHANLYIQRHV